MRESHLTGHLTELAASSIQHLPGNKSRLVADMRQLAVGRLTDLGLPKITDEAWRYTNLRTFEKKSFRPAAKAASKLSVQDLEALKIQSLDRYCIVLLDGWLSESHSMLDQLPDGVECESLKNVLDGDIESSALQQLSTKATAAEHGLEALNAALAADGVVLRVKAGIRLDKPLEILHIAQNEDGLNNINHFVSLEADARLDVVERYVSVTDGAHMTNSSVHIDLADSAEFSHYRIQNENGAAFHIGYASVRLNPSSRHRIFSISLGSLLDRHEVRMQLEGGAAHGEMKGLYIGCGKQQIDNHTTVVHASPDASSQEYYKGILDDRARAVFHGRIRVNPDAQHTDAQQQNRNLLLSPDAEADTKPQLEIYADDVKCSHGATVGHLENDAVFYLRSRGLGETEARTMLTEAFAVEILEDIDLAPVREHLLERVHDKLAGRVHALKEAA